MATVSITRVTRVLGIPVLRAWESDLRLCESALILLHNNKDFLKHNIIQLLYGYNIEALLPYLTLTIY